MSLSFRQRVLLLVAGLVVVAQLASLLAVLTTIERGVQGEMRTDLERGADRLMQLFRRRSTLLLGSAEVLASDFGFRSAIASGDASTILSALENNIGRIDADMASLISPGGRLGVSTLDAASTDAEADGAAYRRLAGEAEEDGIALATVVLGRRARQVVVVPIKAPLTIAWLVLGFSLDDKLAGELGSQVQMQVSFASRRAADEALDFHGSTLAAAPRASLPRAMRSLGTTGAGRTALLAGETYLTREVDLGATQGEIGAILQSSLDEALAGYRRVRWQLMVLTAGFLGIALVFAVRFARGVTRPLVQLSEAARRVGEGDYATLTEIDRQDEFGQLANAFGRMQAGIAEREATIVHRAFYDEPTQLPNRRLAQDRLEASVARARQDGRSVSVALIGIERYRQVVETLGHAVGERMLAELAARLSSRVRRSDTVARVAADEFLLLLHDTREGEADRCLDEMLAEMAAPVRLEAAELVPGPIAGLVTVPAQAREADVAMHRASIALADAREAGVERLHYAEGGDERHLKRLAIVADLKRAVAKDELTLHFQPKVSLADGVARSCEALVRWIHPEHGFMPPDEFIGLAESSGNISLLTDWVLGSAIDHAADWRERGIDIAVAVNLSALDLQDDSLPVRIAEMLKRRSLPPSALILEVTESAMMRDTEQALALLGVLRASGVKLSIDDFGTGYSSLAKLRDLPIDELKIDRAFVVGLESGGVDELIVRTIIELGHGLDLSITVEGVETESELGVLWALGCDVVQGYFYSKPLPGEKFTEWYEAQPAHARERAA